MAQEPQTPCMGPASSLLEALPELGVVLRTINGPRRDLPPVHRPIDLEQVSHLHTDPAHPLQHPDPQHEQERYAEILLTRLRLNPHHHPILPGPYQQELPLRHERVPVQLFSRDDWEESGEGGRHD